MSDALGNVRLNPAFVLKWVASAIQILGYAATGFGLEPWNIGLFLIGVFLWFLVGVLWNDRAIMLIHLVAFSALTAGVLA